MSTRQGAAGIFRIQSAEPATECTSVSCDLASIASEPGTVTALVIAGVVAFVALAYIRDAEADCRNERRRVLDERDAFEEFADRVSGLDPAPVSSTASSLDGSAATVRIVSTANGANGVGNDVRLRRVLVAYRDTVMSLPHYRGGVRRDDPRESCGRAGPGYGHRAGLQRHPLDRGTVGPGAAQPAGSRRPVVAGGCDRRGDRCAVPVRG